MKTFCQKCKKVFEFDEDSPGAEIACPACGTMVPKPGSKTSPGAVIADFLIEREIGRGGMGEVFLAKQISLDRPVALKVLQQSFTNNREYIEGLFSEARAAAKINHPNIVQAYAVGEAEGVVYFAMEYVKGDTCKTLLKRMHVFEFERAAEIVLDVVRALDVAWREQRLVHQDIKPDNIMISSNGFTKLADLGLARIAKDDSHFDAGDEVLGTPQYISPEQLTGVPTDFRSDIYSLGATFYQFVTGQFPYPAKDSDEMARLHVEGKLVEPKKINSHLPDALNSIIKKMMARNINERYQTAAPLLKALEFYLETARQSSTKLPTLNLNMLKAGKTPPIKPPKDKSSQSRGTQPPSGKVNLGAVKLGTGKNGLGQTTTTTYMTGYMGTGTKNTTTTEINPAQTTTTTGINSTTTTGVAPVIPTTTAATENFNNQSAVAKPEPGSSPASSPETSEQGQGNVPVAPPMEDEGKTEKSKSKGMKRIFLPVIILLVLGAGGFGSVYFLAKTGKLPSALAPYGAQLLKTAKATAVTPNKQTISSNQEPAKQPATPVVKPKPVEKPKPVTRQVFLSDVNALMKFLRENPNKKMVMLQRTDAFLKRYGFPQTPEEKNAFAPLWNTYSHMDETERVAPARQKLHEEHCRQITVRREKQEAAMQLAAQEKEKREQEKREAEERDRELRKEQARLEAERRKEEQRRIAETRETIRRLSDRLCMSFLDALSSGDNKEFDEAYQAVRGYRRPQNANSYEERQEERILRDLAQPLPNELRRVDSFYENLSKTTEKKPFVFEIPGERELVYISGFERAGTVMLKGEDQPTPLKLTPTIWWALDRRLDAKCKLKRFRFFYGLLGKYYENDLLKTAPPGFWKKNYSTLLAGYFREKLRNATPEQKKELDVRYRKVREYQISK